MQNITAVVLGANYYVGLSVIRALGKHGVKVVAARIEGNQRVQYGLKSKYVRTILDIPSLDNEPEKAFETLIGFASSCSSKPLLIPTSDSYLLFVDRYLHRLQDSFLLPQIRQGLYKELVDKDSLSILAKEWDILIPKTYLAGELEEDYSVIEKTIGYPCLVKPVNSFKFTPVFNVKLFVAKNEKELKSALNLAREKNIEVFVQQLIKGSDNCMYTYDCYIDKDGQIVQYATFQKQRQFPINFGASTFTKARHVPELHEIGSRFLTGVGFRGFAEIEFKKDSQSGEFYMIEINARTTNFNALLERIGFNAPMLTLKDLKGLELQSVAIQYDKSPFFWAGYEDFAAIRAYIRTGQLTWSEAIKSLFNKKVNAVWSLTDPKPLFRFVSEKLSGAIKKRL